MSAQVQQHYLARRAVALKQNAAPLRQIPLPGDAVAAAHIAGKLGISADEALDNILASRATHGEGARFVKFDAMVKEGRIGICRAGKSQGDFVENMYLCDHWSGVSGASLATAGHALDKLPGELREELDGPEPKKS